MAGGDKPANEGTEGALILRRTSMERLVMAMTTNRTQMSSAVGERDHSLMKTIAG